MPIDERTLARHLNPVFVETGAGPCNGSKLALRLGFPRIYVIEFDLDIYRKAVNRFKDAPEVQVIYGDSGEVLPRILPGIDSPITFWLDAHGKSPDTTRGLTKKPLLRELAAIAAHPLRLQHTILIDDWYVVTEPKRCPHLTEPIVRAALSQINPDFRLSRVDGLVPDHKEPRWQVVVAEPQEEKDS